MKNLDEFEKEKDVYKTLAMFTATSYKELRELAKESIERMALYNMIRKLATDPKIYGII